MFRASFPIAFLRTGWHIVRREPGTPPALTLVSMLFFLALLLVVTSTGIAAAERLVRAGGDINIALSRDATPERRDALRDALIQLPFITHAVIIRKDVALEHTQAQDPDLAAFLASFQLDNPFPDTLNIGLRSANAYGALMQFLQEPTWSDVMDVATLSIAVRQGHELHNVLVVTHGAGALAAFALSVVLLCIGCAVTAFVWRRSTERDEFSWPSTVGMPKESVVMPFAAEHTVLLLLSLGVATAMMLIILPLLPVLIPSLGHDGALAMVRAETARLLFVRLPATVIIFALLCPPLAWLGVLPQSRTLGS